MPHALILTYHAVESGPPPLCVDPAQFREHLEAIAASGRRTVTVAELPARLREGQPLVALTFDDGFASLAEHAVPLLEERGMTATVYCVAGHLGGRNDWPSARANGYRADLLGAEQVAELARRGIEIGSHGVVHAPLSVTRGAHLRREVVESKERLEAIARAPVSSYALPYGALPDADGAALLERTYRTVCTTRASQVAPDCSPHALPRVDAHYLRRPELLRRALQGDLRLYLAARRLAAAARRKVRKDYVGG